MKRMIRSSSNSLFDEETERILREADTSDWAQMQSDYYEDEIDKAGGYDRYIANEKKRNIYSSEEIMSQLSFDFAHDGYYSEADINSIIEDALADAGAEFVASSFDSVDYSNVPEWRDADISQVSADFTWYDDADYNADSITRSIEEGLTDLGYELVGIDFRSLEYEKPVRSGTEVKTYRNKRNPNKYVEVHEDGYGHRSAKQYMHWDETDVTNPTGDGNLHRWRKGNIDDLLEDYEEIDE